MGHTKALPIEIILAHAGAFQREVRSPGDVFVDRVDSLARFGSAVGSSPNPDNRDIVLVHCVSVVKAMIH
jgi:uncharacterized protein (DUF934 family)